MTAWLIGAALLGAQVGAGHADAAPRPAAAPMAAQTADAPACPATPTPLPAAYAGWGATPVTAGSEAASAPALVPGRGARVTLGDAAAVRWAAAPGHAPAPASHGGIVALSVAAAGRYRVALGTGAWIDLVGDGAAVRSVAHAHGPACTLIRKLVDFDLSPGRYLIQLSGTAAPTIDAMALRVAE